MNFENWKGFDDLNYYFCDACRYCFSAEKLPDRCPDCGAQIYKEKPAVRLANNNEIKELLRIRAEGKENNTLLSGENI